MDYSVMIKLFCKMITVFLKLITLFYIDNAILENEYAI